MDITSLKDSLKFIDSWLDFNFRDSRLPGLSVAVAHKGKVLYCKSFGHANLEAKEILTNDHVFRVASHSKTFTATAIMQLKEQGKLRLDDRVSDHLPWFESSEDPRVKQLTIRHLLNHVSGMIRDGEESDYWVLDEPFLDGAFFKEYIKTVKLIKAPDEVLKYSNFGYSYLGMIVEAVSGISYRDYITNRIINELGLKNTGADLSQAKGQRLATGYGQIVFNESRRQFDHVDTRGMTSATGVYSTAGDMCRYFSAHLMGNTKLISDASKREMQHDYWHAQQDEESYGLGFSIKHGGEGTWLGHSGGFPGFITATRFNQDDGIVISVMCNAIDAPTSYIVDGIIKSVSFFQNNGREKKSKYDLGRFEGIFFSVWGEVAVVKVNQSLVSIGLKQWNTFDYVTELVVKDEHTLSIGKTNSYASPGEEYVYQFAKDGGTRSVRMAGTDTWPYEVYYEKYQN